MKTLIVVLFLSASAVLAQPPVAPSNEPVGNARGDNEKNYNIMQSFELGYRFASVGGDADMYRSTVNYTNGVRLLVEFALGASREGHGRLVRSDRRSTRRASATIRTSPHPARSRKIDLYRYDMMWRSDAYYNPALTIADGEHFHGHHAHACRTTI